MLKGKSIVITGAGRGLGRAAALDAAARGASVVVNDIDAELAAATADEIVAAGGSAVASSHSVADAESAHALIEQCVSTYGRIDGLVNNAGLTLTGAPWESDAADVDRLVDVNVKGVLHCGMAALPHMRDQRSGVVVNLTSRTHIGWYNAAIYVATKGAVASLTYGWALDMAEYGVRVVGFAPTAQTRMAVPGSTVADPGDVARAIIYLLSDRAHRLSGQVLRFNNEHLSLLRQPVFDEPSVERDGFTVEEIADAVDETLVQHISKVGPDKVDLSSITDR